MKNKTYHTVFELLKAALFNIPPDFPEDVDWDAVYSELLLQTVAGIPYEWAMENLDLSDEISNRWSNHTFTLMNNFMRNMYGQDEILKLLNDNGIETAILKGAAAAVNYPKPEYRAMGDIDLIVRKSDYKRACALMLDDGYKFIVDEKMAYLELEDDNYCHAELEKFGIEYELHKTLTRISGDKYGVALNTVLENSFASIEYHQIGDYSVPMFAPEMNGIVLIRHVAQHLSSGLGLRQIIDWMMFADKYLDDDEWNSKYKKVYKKTGLEKLAKITTKMCQTYLGLRKDISWCSDADDALCQQLMDYVMVKGNMGVKLGKSDEDWGTSIIYNSNGIIGFFRHAQDEGVKKWQLAKRYKCLRCFAWAYQLCRYIRKAFARKNPVKALLSDLSKGNKRKTMFEQLDVRGLVNKIEETGK